MSKRPASPLSPTVKKAKIRDHGSSLKQGGNDKEPQLSKGAEWMIRQIDSMQKSYREALLAAVSILQHRKNAKKLHVRGVPKQLTRMLEKAWAAYSVTRRHVEWYMNALHASTPSHPAIIMPTSQAPVAPAIPELLKSEAAINSKASPIDLSSASMLAYDGNNAAATNQQSTFDGSLNFDTSDLSSMGIGELSAMINDNDSLFGSSGIQGATGADGMFNNSASDGTATGAAQTAQTETDKLLASLGGLPQTSETNPVSQGMGETTGIAEDGDVNALLASLDSSAQVDVGGQNLNFDFGGAEGTGEVDLSELAGLFSDAEVAAATGVTGSVPDATQATAAPVVDLTEPATTDNAPTQVPDLIPAAPQAAPNAEPDSNPEGLITNPDLGAIDLDEFNFGDSDMPNVEGDEFESLFAEFK